jgi:hypothetical protein
VKNLLQLLKQYYKYLFFIPILYGIIIVLLYGVDILFMDEWEVVRFWEHIEQNGWMNSSLYEMLFSQHNEHRLFFPRIIMLISYKLSFVNTKINMFMTQLMVISVYVFYIRYYNKKQEILTHCHDNVTTLFIFLSGIACFSNVQFELFLWGFQFAFYMAIFGVVICLYYFHQFLLQGNRKNCILSLLFGIIASFSSSHGLIIWPVMIVLIFICFVTGERFKVKNLLPYIIIGLSSFFIYFNGWTNPKHHPLSHDPYIILKFFFGSLGGMYITNYSKLTVFFGGITFLFSLGIILLLFVQKKIKKAIFPVGLIGYSYAVLFAIAIGRSGFGIEMSTRSAYISFSILSYIGISMLVHQFFLPVERKNNEHNKKHLIKFYFHNFALCMLILFSILIIMGNFNGISKAKIHKDFLLEAVDRLKNYENQPLEKLSRLYPWSTYNDMYKMIGIIKRYKLNVFSNSFYNHTEIPVSRLNGLNKIELDHYVGMGTESFTWDDKFISIPNSWAIDYISGREYTQVYMNVNGRLYRTADHLSSPDVAEYFKNKHYRNVRFSFSFPVEYLNIGENNFSALVLLNDGVTYYESNTVKIFLDSSGNISFNSEINISEEEEINLRPIFKMAIPRDISLIPTYDIHSMKIINDNLLLECGIFDPQVAFQLFEPLNIYSRELFVKIKCSNTNSGTLQVFYDFGNGFSEPNSFKTFIDNISEMTEIYLPVPNWNEGEKLVSVRIDPPDGTIFGLESIEIMEK